MLSTVRRSQLWNVREIPTCLFSKSRASAVSLTAPMLQGACSGSISEALVSMVKGMRVCSLSSPNWLPAPKRRLLIYQCEESSFPNVARSTGLRSFDCGLETWSLQHLDFPLGLGGDRTNLDGGRNLGTDWVAFASYRYTVVPIECSTNSDLVDCIMTSTTISIRDARTLECVTRAHISTSAGLCPNAQDIFRLCNRAQSRGASSDRSRVRCYL